MAFRFLFCIVFVLSALIGKAQKKEIVFDVFLNGKNIGILIATEEISGTQVTRDIRSKTDAKILMLSIHVESEVKAVHDVGILQMGVAYRHASRGSEDVHSKVEKVSDNKYRLERNGLIRNIDHEISFNVAELYFKEPTGFKEVFSTMWADFIPVKPTEQGTYTLVTPDKKSSSYIYKEGELQSVTTEISLGTISMKRRP